ncbi:hypothetical protein KUV51_21195 [Tateyamaria omphalii]|uniref:hypothetical protein n=1 Tax=Tateyamaria omphalii TaxID=299262 RepID=UPI001C9988ED|nr:hypothetical protein [Tateyamaria omphalii]MBY5935538.1 hypothetical protein [Tateyamaria omphalii]
MTRTCHLHIGTTKTGSTSIQRTYQDLDDGRTRYLQLRIPNHSRVLTALYAPDDAARADALRLAKLTPAKAAQWRTSMQAQIADHPDSDLVISGEGLSKWADARMVAALADDLAAFDNVHVLAYLRAPGSWMASSFQQQLRNAALPFDLDALFPLYRDWFQPWEDVFGADAVTLVPFDPTGFPNGDVVADFAARCGLPAPDRPLPREKPALPAEAVAVLYAHRMARGTPPLADRSDALVNRAVVDGLRSLGQTRFAIDPAALAPVAARHDDQISWAQARMGPFPPVSEPVSPTFGTAADLQAFATAQIPGLHDMLRNMGVRHALPDDAIELVDTAYAQARATLPGS